jgi:hypothetical protein
MRIHLDIPDEFRTIQPLLKETEALSLSNLASTLISEWLIERDGFSYLKRYLVRLRDVGEYHNPRFFDQFPSKVGTPVVFHRYKDVQATLDTMTRYLATKVAPDGE